MPSDPGRYYHLLLPLWLRQGSTIEFMRMTVSPVPSAKMTMIVITARILPRVCMNTPNKTTEALVSHNLIRAEYYRVVEEALRRGEPPLDPDDAQRFLRIYQDLITAGDRDAIWRFMAFEVNLDAEPDEAVDPHTIDQVRYPTAQSVAFFETRLFLHGAFEAPTGV